MRGPTQGQSEILSETTGKSRNSYMVSCGMVGAEGIESDFADDLYPETNNGSLS